MFGNNFLVKLLGNILQLYQWLEELGLRVAFHRENIMYTSALDQHINCIVDIFHYLIQTVSLQIMLLHSKFFFSFFVCLSGDNDFSGFKLR